jgi:hypothetical protein
MKEFNPLEQSIKDSSKSNIEEGNPERGKNLTLESEEEDEFIEIMRIILSRMAIIFLMMIN